MARRRPAKSTLVYTGSLPIERGAVPYEVRAERRRDTRFSLTGRKAYLRVPASTHRDSLPGIIRDFEAWLVGAVTKRPDLASEHRPTAYRDGEVWRLGEYAFRLAIAGADLKGASAKQGSPDEEGVIPLQIKLPRSAREAERAELIEILLYRMAAQRARPAVEVLLDEVNDAHFGVDVHRVKLSPTRSRWGSCSRTGTVSISTRLLGAPPDVLRAVLVHELAHRLEMNHSERFWALVYAAMPDYREWDAWLKREGAGLGWTKDEGAG